MYTHHKQWGRRGWLRAALHPSCQLACIAPACTELVCCPALTAAQREVFTCPHALPDAAGRAGPVPTHRGAARVRDGVVGGWRGVGWSAAQVSWWQLLAGVLGRAGEGQAGRQAATVA